MYKLFAVICIMTTGELQCTTYDDSEKQAAYRFYGMAEVFDAYQIPWDTMEVGCEAGDES